MSYKKIDIHPISASIGAEIRGVDLSQPLDEETRREIKQAWLDYLVLFFREQELTPAQFRAFALEFGDVKFHPFIRNRVDDEPDVERLELAKTPPTAPPTSILHIDVSSDEIPTKATLLYAVDVPEFGGDTIWVNAYAAYDALSKPMKELLDGCSALFPSLDVAALDRFVKAGPEAIEAAARFIKVPIEHPLVHTHPETGKKALFIDPLRMWSITDLNYDESQSMMDFLNRHISKPEFQCRFHWQPKSVAVWDNRCTLHKRVDDVVQGRRLMHRVPIEGTERPVL